MKGFRAFLLRGNVVDLAVAVIIGAAFGNVISSFVKNLMTPLIAAMGGQPDFSSLSFTVNNSHFYYGEFINAAISFLIVSAVIYYLVVVPIQRANQRKVEGAIPLTRKCPECLSDVPVQARKCPQCTSAISPTESAKVGT